MELVTSETNSVGIDGMFSLVISVYITAMITYTSVISSIHWTTPGLWVGSCSGTGYLHPFEVFLFYCVNGDELPPMGYTIVTVMCVICE